MVLSEVPAPVALVSGFVEPLVPGPVGDVESGASVEFGETPPLPVVLLVSVDGEALEPAVDVGALVLPPDDVASLESAELAGAGLLDSVPQLEQTRAIAHMALPKFVSHAR